MVSDRTSMLFYFYGAFALSLFFYFHGDLKDMYQKLARKFGYWRNSSNKQDSDGRTPIYHASKNGDLNKIRELLSKKADIHIPDDEGKLPLHAACMDGNLEIVDILLSQGSKCNAVDKVGGTPLLYTVQNGRHHQLEVIKLLLSRKADPNIAYGWLDERPLQVASENGNLSVVRELIANQADINAADQYGCTALLSASENGHPEVVRELLSMGADHRATNKKGQSARSLAVENRHYQVTKLLARSGLGPPDTIEAMYDTFGPGEVSRDNQNNHADYDILTDSSGSDDGS